MQSVSPVVSGGASAHCWVQGCRVSQLRLRHLTCGRAIEWAHTRMPHARGVAPARRDPPETRRPYASKEENGRVPRIAVRDVAGDNSCFLHRGYASTRISAPAGTTPVST